MMKSRRVGVFAVVFLLTLLADQGSKAWARSLPPGQPQTVIDGYWDWELAMNDGAAFSSARGARVPLTVVAIGALVVLGVMVKRTKPEETLKCAAYALIAGGALGNLVDRIHDGVVTDFVSWRIHEHRWPIFNVADVALLIGALLLIAEIMLSKRRTAILTT